MANFDEGKGLRKLQLGIKVERAAAAHAAAAVAFFHVYAGIVLLTGLVGRVTVAAVGATTMVWTHVPTTGTTQPVAASLDVDPALVGDLLTINGLASSAATYNASALGLPMMANKVLLPIGDLTCTFGQASGSSSWTLFYVPIDDGAYVRAV